MATGTVWKKYIYIDTQYRSVANKGERAEEADRAWPAAQAISTACEIMQIVAEPNELLPSIADRVVAAVGRLRNRFVRSAPAPAPAAAAAAAFGGLFS